jgi:hypothetical protein
MPHAAISLSSRPHVARRVGRAAVLAAQRLQDRDARARGRQLRAAAAARGEADLSGRSCMLARRVCMMTMRKRASIGHDRTLFALLLPAHLARLLPGACMPPSYLSSRHAAFFAGWRSTFKAGISRSALPGPPLPLCNSASEPLGLLSVVYRRAWRGGRYQNPRWSSANKGGMGMEGGWARGEGRGGERHADAPTTGGQGRRAGRRM